MLRPFLAASTVLLFALPVRAEPPPDAATLTYLPSRATVALCPAADFFALEVQSWIAGCERGWTVSWSLRAPATPSPRASA